MCGQLMYIHSKLTATTLYPHVQFRYVSERAMHL